MQASTGTCSAIFTVAIITDAGVRWGLPREQAFQWAMVMHACGLDADSGVAVFVAASEWVM
jgi:hypothetical protein